jgi:hypothetical protein
MKGKDCKIRAFWVTGTPVVSVLISGELRAGVFDELFMDG